MENQRLVADILRQEIHQIRERIESGNDTLPNELGFPRYLEKIEQFLSSGNLDKETLERYDFGIFRLVTESYTFEQSALGKELLSLGTKIGNLAHELP
jgi:hypothetical protein